MKLGDRPERQWEEAALRWLDETTHKRTHEKDVEILKWMDPYLAGKRLSDITMDLLSTIANAKAKESSRATANRYMALVRAILNRAVRKWEWIDRAPHVPMFKVDSTRVRCLTREEAEKLLS